MNFNVFFLFDDFGSRFLSVWYMDENNSLGAPEQSPEPNSTVTVEGPKCKVSCVPRQAFGFVKVVFYGVHLAGEK